MFSGDDDAFDEEMNCDMLMLQYLNYNKPSVSRRIRPRVQLFNYYSDEEFVKRFRMDKDSVMGLFKAIEKKLTPRTMRNNAVEPLNKLLATLRFFATGSFMQVFADLGGYSATSARDFIALTIRAIAGLRPHHVSFPRDMERVKKEFFNVAKFPNVLMAIDCTHVKLLSPGGDDAEIFRNRKGFFSLNVQTVCDSQLRIMDCVARWPGSTHDQRIFNNSRLRHLLESGHFGSGIVVGDSGYENRPYLVTPLLKCASRAENLFNESLIRTRNCIERSYGVMKRRFPVLAIGLRCSLNLAMATIHAVTVCHNLALNDPLPAPEVDAGSYEDAKIIVERASGGQGSVQRKIIDQYFAKM